MIYFLRKSSFRTSYLIKMTFKHENTIRKTEEVKFIDSSLPDRDNVKHPYIYQNYREFLKSTVYFV
jgi:hypothetical protein